jgi:putative transposase
MSFDLTPIGQPDLEIPKPRTRRDVTHDCEYQVVWCTKYARPLLEDVKGELHELLQATAGELAVEVVQVLVTDDAVSMTLRVDPVQGIHRAVTRLKAVTSSTLRRKHPRLKSRAPSLWNSRYLVASVGKGAKAQTLREFLEQQRRG